MNIEQIRELSKVKAEWYLTKKLMKKNKIKQYLKFRNEYDWEEYNDFFHWTPPLEV